MQILLNLEDVVCVLGSLNQVEQQYFARLN